MITVKTNETQEPKPFPKLMQSTLKRVVLFSKESCGVLMEGDETSFAKIGEYANCWGMESFTDYNEPITIQNA